MAPYRRALQTLAAEFARFGVVGLVCTIVDFGLFNLVHFGLGVDPLVAKTVSVVVATTVSYLGNRHWSFRHRARSGFRREYALFFALNAVGLAIALVFLAVTKYVLGFTGPLALNLAGNVLGMGTATVFRFWSYRRWVFRPSPAAPAAATAANIGLRAAPATLTLSGSGAKVPAAAEVRPAPGE